MRCFDTRKIGAGQRNNPHISRDTANSALKGKTMPKGVTATALPAQSALHERIGQGDFLDCYRVEADLAPRRAAEIITEFPGWVRLLVVLRNALTAPFGLSGTGPSAKDKIGFFPVESETSSELIAGFNDRHLDFRISVLSRQGHVFLATWVHPHNIGGRLYLRTIMPFHILISRNALTRVASASG